MDDKRSKQIDRIVKLFRLGSKDANTTEGEMMLAVTKARQMMAEHGISMFEVESAKGHDIAAAMDARLRSVPVYSRAGTRLADYDWNVATAVGELTDTKVFEQRRWGATGKSSRRPEGGYGRLTSVLFVGDEDDVALAGQLFHMWLRDVRRLARARYGGGNSWGKLHTSYAIGVAVRLQARAREMVHLSKADQQTWGLVLSNKKNAIARWEAKHTKPTVENKRQRTTSIDHEAFNEGYRDGVRVNMATKIMGGGG